MRLVLRNCGMVDPRSIEEYIASGGYSALEKVLTTMTPDEVIQAITASGLRGRGGAGFPTGRKWASTKRAEGECRYIVANGDEGDPGAFMDRSIMEGDPYAILEGMTIGAYAIENVREGYIYVRDEYPLAVENLRLAIEHATEMGLLGDHILGSDFSFNVKIVRGAGAFVCGESSALMQSLEGSVGEPRPKHVHATESGLWGQPTALNNVETWANVPIIINMGADEYAKIGTANSKGTKAFCLVGKVRNTGLIEVPMGTRLRTIIEEIGGGVLGGKGFKAVQTGGPSGGCIPADFIDLPVDYERLAEVGSIMGSGGMIVIDEESCMVDMARYFLTFTENESCGKCVPCRMGTQHLLRILTDITEGRGSLDQIETMRRIGDTMKNASLCGLGQTAANPVLSTLTSITKRNTGPTSRTTNVRPGPAGRHHPLRHRPGLLHRLHGLRPGLPGGGHQRREEKPHLIDQERCIQRGSCRRVQVRGRAGQLDHAVGHPSASDSHLRRLHGQHQFDH